jgi:hypothetical protein
MKPIWEASLSGSLTTNNAKRWCFGFTARGYVTFVRLRGLGGIVAFLAMP